MTLTNDFLDRCEDFYVESNQHRPIAWAMSAIDPTEARFHADDPPGVTLPPATVLVGALVAGALMWVGVFALAGTFLGWAHSG